MVCAGQHRWLGGSVSGNSLAQDGTKSLEVKMVKKISSLLGLDLRVMLAHGAGTWCLCKQPQHFCCGIFSSMALVGMEVKPYRCEAARSL